MAAVTIPAIIILVALGLSAFGCIYVLIHTLVHVKTLHRHKLFPLALLFADLIFVGQEAAQVIGALLQTRFSVGSCKLMAILRAYSINAHALAFMCMSAIAFWYFLSSKRPRPGNWIVTSILFVIPFAVPIVSVAMANYNDREDYLCGLTYAQDEKYVVPVILASIVISFLLVLPVPFIHGFRHMPSLEPFSPFPMHILAFGLQVAMFVVVVFIYKTPPSIIIFTIQEFLLSAGGFIDATMFWTYIVRPHKLQDLHPGADIFGADAAAFDTELDPFEGGKVPPGPAEYAFGARARNATMSGGPGSAAYSAVGVPRDGHQPLLQEDDEPYHQHLSTPHYRDDGSDIDTQSRTEYDVDGRDSLDGPPRQTMSPSGYGSPQRVASPTGRVKGPRPMSPPPNMHRESLASSPRRVERVQSPEDREMWNI